MMSLSSLVIVHRMALHSTLPAIPVELAGFRARMQAGRLARVLRISPGPGCLDEDPIQATSYL